MSIFHWTALRFVLTRSEFLLTNVSTVKLLLHSGINKEEKYVLAETSDDDK
jgi:hypothetical protein